jgi:DNA-directed RNA polymerase subunit H (RpoH/RPB5)
MEPPAALLQLLAQRCAPDVASGAKVFERVLASLEEMLRDRAYSDIQRTTLDSTNCLLLVFTANDPNDSIIRVYFDCEERVSVKTLRAVDPVGHAIVVSIAGPTPFARKEATSTSIEWFFVKQLLLAVPRHTLVPKHRRLTDAEADATCKRYHVLHDQLPLLLSTDPVCRWFNFPPNSIIEITRRGVAAEECLYYRRVVAVAR